MHYWLCSFIATYLLIAVWSSTTVALVILCILLTAVTWSLLFHLPRQVTAILMASSMAMAWSLIVMTEYTSNVANVIASDGNKLVQGTVISIQSNTNQTKFNIRVSNPSGLDGSRLRLSWRSPVWSIKQGQQVQLMVKLSPPKGLNNHHNFNFAKWLLSQDIHGTGYVKASADNKLLLDNVSLRQTIVDRIDQLPLTYSAWLMALTVGYRGELSAQDWQFLQRSGTAHLVAISGLHVGMVSVSLYFLLRYLFALLAICAGRPWLSVRPLALLTVCVAVIGYTVLAGASPPTLRACIMFCLITGLLWFDRRISGLDCLLMFVSLAVMFDPLTVFSLSLWMSLYALLCVWLVVWRWPWNTKQKLLWTVRFQLILSLLMMPLVAWQFGIIAWTSPLLNLFAVPFVTLFLLPLALISLLLIAPLPTVSQSLLVLWDNVLAALLQWLMPLYQTPIVSVPVEHIEVSVWVFAWLLGGIWILPIVWHNKWRWFFSGSLLISTLFAINKPTNPTVKLHVFDVGHGLASVLIASGKAIVYDVGARYSSGFNMADAVLLPSLKKLGVRGLEHVFISHDDNDHSGSLPALIAGMDIKQLHHPSDNCVSGQHYQWQGSRLFVLWPISRAVKPVKNNGSCVLLVELPTAFILFAGDIEKSAERRMLSALNSRDDLPLLQQRSKPLVLIAPHHGSQTSSTTEFVAYFKPEHVIFSQRQHTRWRLPHPAVVERYLASGAKIYETGQLGQVTVSFLSHGVAVSSYSATRAKRWYHYE